MVLCDAVRNGLGRRGRWRKARVGAVRKYWSGIVRQVALGAVSYGSVRQGGVRRGMARFSKAGMAAQGIVR